MSGIMGIHHLNGQPVQRGDLKRMVDTLAHRGPDGSEIWIDGAIGFGHRMLWTTPESLLETLPMVNEKGDLVITADARIDNRNELQVLLDLPDRSIEKITDSEFILAAYEKWGESCPEYLLGDFSFAIWDQCKQKLFCARDHFGVKPFYYYLSGQSLIFASEIKAIFCISEVSQKINEVKIGDFLISNFNDTIKTSYFNILKLPPAHTLTLSDSDVSLHRYWSLDPSFTLHLSSDQEYAERFRELFTEAVRCRLRSAFPVGTTLSGGLDSSSITCVARNLLAAENQSLHTFSVIFDQITECDERFYINTVLAQENLQPHYVPHYVHGDQRTALSDIEKILWHEEEPSAALNLGVTTWGICSAALTENIRVVLDGHDGDGVVSHGFGYLNELAKEGQWFALMRQLKGVAKIYGESPWVYYWTYLQTYSIDPFIAKTAPLKLIRRLWQAARRRIPSKRATDSTTWHTWLNPDLVDRLDLKSRYRTWMQAQVDSNQTSRAEHYYTVTQGLQTHALEVLNKATSAFPIEQRYPFWDKRLVEFCLSLPPEQKLYQGWSRMVLRRAMTDILPPEIQWRTTKADFTPNLRYGLATFEQERLSQVIDQDASLIEPYVNLGALRQSYDRLSQNIATNKDVSTLWKIATLSLWLRSIRNSNDSSLPETSKEAISAK